jgi:AcrR family transcriptional regulator
MGRSDGMARPSVAKERRRELANSARRAIARKGVASATLRDVAQGAGLSTGIVSYYFKGKQEVVNSAIDLAARQFQERVARRSAVSAAPRARLEAHVRAVFDGSVRERREELAFWAECWSEATRSAAVRNAHQQRFRAWVAELQAIISAGQESDDFSRDAEPSMAAAQIACIIDGVWLHSVIDASALPPRELADATVALAIKVLAADGS